MVDFIDFCTEAGARILVERIKAYWQRKGYPKIEAWIEQRKTHGPLGRPIQYWKIKSNLNQLGYPPK
jgi:hypothetical protein